MKHVKSFSFFFISLQHSSFSGMYRIFRLAFPHNRFGSSMHTLPFLLAVVAGASS